MADMNQDFLQWLLGQTGIAGIAGLALWMLRKSFDDLKQAYAEREKQRVDNLEVERDRSDKLMQIIEDNTKVNTQLAVAVQAVVQSTNHCQAAQEIMHRDYMRKEKGQQ